MNQDDTEPTLYENEAASVHGGDFKSRVASRLTGVRKTLGSITKKKTSVVQEDSSPIKNKLSFKAGGNSSSASKADIEKAASVLARSAEPQEQQDALKTLSGVKSAHRPFLLSQLQQHKLFATTLPALAQSFPDKVAAIVLDVSSQDEQLTTELYRELRANPDFYGKFLAMAGTEEDALLTLVNVAKCAALRTDLLADLKDLWTTGLVRWIRYPTSPEQLLEVLQLLQGLSMEEANRVSMYSDLKPAEKSLMDLITQHRVNNNEEALRLSLSLFGNLAAHRYNASYLGHSLKPVWSALQELILAKDTAKDVLLAVVQLMGSLSSVRDNNEVFAYLDVKPLLSSLMDLVRNGKTAPALTLAVVALWNNLASIHENRPVIHSDLKAMWPTFVQFVSKPATPDALVLMTLSLLNNLAFSTDNQVEMYSILRPHWPALLNHVRSGKTHEIQSMTVLLMRNLAVASENKHQIFRDSQPIWPTLLDSLKSPHSSDELDYGVCHLLWNLSKLESNRAEMFQGLLPVFGVILTLIQDRKSKENVYALLALLKNLAQSPENRQMMALDLKPHFQVLIGLFDLEDNVDELELTVWLFQSLAKERENQSLLYKELKPVWPKLCSLLRMAPSEEVVDQILSFWAFLAMGRVHAAWVYVDLEPVRTKLKELLDSPNPDVVASLLQLWGNLAVDPKTAEWMYADLAGNLDQIVGLAQTGLPVVREYSLRLLSAFAKPALREDVLANQPAIVQVLVDNERDLDCAMGLAILCGEGHANRVAEWFTGGNEGRVVLVISVLEDCTVTGEWGYEMARPLQALSHLVSVDALRAKVKVAMLLDAIEASWKKRDYDALQYAYATIKHCVTDENNEMRFQGNVALMETARKLSVQNDQDAAKREALAFLAKFSDAAGQYA